MIVTPGNDYSFVEILYLSINVTVNKVRTPCVTYIVRTFCETIKETSNDLRW